MGSNFKTFLSLSAIVLLLAACNQSPNFERQTTEGTTLSDGPTDYVSEIDTEEELEAAIELYSCGKSANPKVRVCHVPPGNPENAHEICISVHALNAHLTHHEDYLGDCKPEGEGGGDDNEEGGEDGEQGGETPQPTPPESPMPSPTPNVDDL